MPSVITRTLGFTAITLGIVAPLAKGHFVGNEEHLTINATSDFTSLHAGDAGLLAIDIVVEEGWHTYWPGVSDTGYGFSFNIEAPDSIELKDPIWPSPERYLQPGDILDHTYEETVTVLYPFVIKESTPESVIVFNIEADYLVCKEYCLPGKGTTSTTLQVVDTESEKAESSRHDELRKLFDSRPQPFNAKDLAVRFLWISTAVAVMFRDATRIEFYPDSECTPMESVIEDGAKAGNRLEIRFTESENKVLSGRLRVTTREGVEHYDIHEKAP